VSDFAALLARRGVREEFVQRGRVGFMAYHGGALEAMTDVIASAAAERSDASYYGVIQPEGMREHIASIRVDPAASPRLQAFFDHVEVVVTVHGFGRRGMFASLLLGGGNRTFAGHVAGHLRRALPAYEIVDELDAIPSTLRGLHPRNPVNLAPRQGVQIELPPRVRGSSPLWWDWDGPGWTPHTSALVDALAAAARSWASRPPSAGTSSSRAPLS
jgi:phage replication-related protein YjqB (UPF0714/DUF867 family)